MSGDKTPLDVCCNAAEQICQIVGDHVPDPYKFPCNLIFPIKTAATTLAHYASLDRLTPDCRYDKLLAMCIRWLSVLGRNSDYVRGFRNSASVGEFLP